MIWRKRKTSRQRDAVAYKQAAPVGIGETRDEQRTREAEDERDVIREVRDYLWRTRFCCQLCQGARWRECEGFPDEMHEHRSRAETRGLPPRVRFNAMNCGRLCHACHVDVTRHRIEIRFADDKLGFLGRCWAYPGGVL